MNKIALLQLADLLEQVAKDPSKVTFNGMKDGIKPPAGWDMETWYEDTTRGGKPCGTVACALGWAAAVGIAGLKIVNAASDGSEIPHPSIILEGENGEWLYSIMAAEAAFDLDWHRATRLFWPDKYRDNYEDEPITIEEVVARIRKMVAEEA